MLKRIAVVSLMSVLGVGCAPDGEVEAPMSEMEAKLAQYRTVRLTTDLSLLTDAEKSMIPLLVEAADAGENLYGLDRLANLLSSMRSQSPHEIVSACLRDVHTYLDGSESGDDLTIMALRFCPTGPETK